VTEKWVEEVNIFPYSLFEFITPPKTKKEKKREEKH